MASPDSCSSCPFCKIAAASPPAAFGGDAHSQPFDPSVQGSAHLILSTDHVLAFLDIMPLTNGHVLVAPRQHYEKLGDMGVAAGQEMGKWLPIISRVVTKVIFGDDPDRHWNVVQNNGERAAQQVPHVHFHIIPRPSDFAHKPSFAMFGRGQRHELDDEEGAELARAMRVELELEVERIKRDEGIDLSQKPGKGKL
ncbi:Hit family protein 1 [Penicillium diatomitis]|uniref:Hit family protein 1 n=1 Tax=Penicillium diatomitis TaxID=2819901 RepID=A0A9W9X2S0_9EURO|nr:Hit family protein 1 [Penicillium diatomitis]KAJ5482653.1 Hit family protein 1 [Penicillium diatomitis]